MNVMKELMGFPGEKYILVLLLVFMLHGWTKESHYETAMPVKSVSVPAALASSEPQKLVDTSKENEFTPLMAAVFGSGYKADLGVAVAELADPSNRKKRVSFVITPVARTKLNTGETVLVASAEFADEDGRPMSSHASPGLLNVFFLTQSAGHWSIVARHENIAELGSSGVFGQVSWVQVGPGKPGFAVQHGWTGQGYNMGLIALFEIRGRAVQALTPKSIMVNSDNLGVCEDDSPECWDISADWRLLVEPDQPYASLQLVFSGEETRLPSEQNDGKPSGQKRLVTKLYSAAKYQFDGKQYELVEGENIVREF
jgi:hypothetical protein